MDKRKKKPDDDLDWSDDAPIKKSTSKLKMAEAEAVPKKDGESGVGKGKSKKQHSVRLTDEARKILTAVKHNKEKHGLSNEAFVAQAICKYGKEILKDDFPALREAPVEYAAERLTYLEQLIIGPKWQKLASSEKAPNLALDLTVMIQEFRFEPHAVDLKKANAWREKHGNGKTKTFKREDVILAAYARNLGLLAKKNGK